MEMVSCDRIAAIAYLQSEVAQVVDHSAPKEESEFQSLAVKLFGDSSPSYNYYSLMHQTDRAVIHQLRTKVRISSILILHFFVSIVAIHCICVLQCFVSPRFIID